MVVDLINFAIK